MNPGITVIYDGQCPFCTSYVRLLRLRDAVGPVKLVDARQDDLSLFGPLPDLNEGMMVLYGGNRYYGADAINFLSTISSRSGFLNSAMAALFRRPALAKGLYPLLKAGRRATLWALGRKPIAQA